MRVITRQFTKEVLLSALFVLVGLVALFAFFDLIGQLDDVGRNRTMLQAVILTLLSLPERIYEVMPLAALLASVYIMSRWAATSEFTVLRVAGMSPVSLAKSLLIPGIILVGFTYLFGEFLAPPAARYTTEVKAMGSHRTTLNVRGYDSGVWIRDVTEGISGEKISRYINVKYLLAGRTGETGGWRLFEIDAHGHLQYLIQSQSASYIEGKGWMLHQVVRTQYPKIARSETEPTDKRVVVEPMDDFLLKSSLGPDILGVMTVKPEKMSMRDLNRYIGHLKKNNQKSAQYEVAFWNKVFYPLATFVMLALAMPFAYMNARSGGMAIKMFVGVILGITFYALNNVFSYLGVLNTWPPIAVCLFPTVMMMIIAGVALAFVERR